MANESQIPSTSLWLPANINEDSFATSQPAGNLVGFTETSDVDSPASAQPSSLSGPRGMNNDSDALIVIEVDSDAESSTQSVTATNTRHRPSSTGSVSSIATNHDEESRQNASADVQSTSDRGSSDIFYNLLNRLGLLMHDSEVQEVLAVVLVNLLPLVILVLCKVLLTNFAGFFTIVMAYVCFNMANVALLSSFRRRKYLNLLQSTFFVHIFIITDYFIDGADDVFLPMLFVPSAPILPTFFSTLHSVLLLDFTIKLLTIQLKTLVAFIPSAMLSNKRRRHRIYQWLEYTSQLYRYLLPIPRWYHYLSYPQSSHAAIYYSDIAFVVLYLIFKALLFPMPFYRWLHSTRFVFCISSIGTIPSHAELSHFPQCTICFSEVVDPVKLRCGHVFCDRCIGVWLDSESTCPNCRAVVSHEDNAWKNGSTSYLPQFC